MSNLKDLPEFPMKLKCEKCFTSNFCIVSMKCKSEIRKCIENF